MRNSKSNSEVIGSVIDWYSSGDFKWCKGRWFSDRSYNTAQPGHTGFNLEVFLQEEAACLAGSLALMNGMVQMNTGIIDHISLPCTVSVDQAIRELFPERHSGESEPVSNIINFNDNAETSQEDVMLVLKHALEEEREREEKLKAQEEENIRFMSEVLGY